MRFKLAIECESVSGISNTLLFHSIGLCTSATLLRFTGSPREHEIFRQKKPTAGNNTRIAEGTPEAL
jgi:hypothetical protein